MHHNLTVNSTSGSNRPAEAQPHSHALLNVVMKWLLRSPLHGLVSQHFMLLTFTGRKSGKQFTTPVTYVRNGDTIHFFSNQKWWKNLQGGARVVMRVRGAELQGFAEPTQDKPTVVREMQAFLKRMGVKKAYMINLAITPNLEPTQAELLEAAQGHVVVYIKLEEKS